MSNKKWLVLILHVIAYIERSEFSKPCNFGRKSNRNQIDISVFKANQCDMVQIKRMLLDFYASYYKHFVYTHLYIARVRGSPVILVTGQLQVISTLFNGSCQYNMLLAIRYEHSRFLYIHY